MQCLGSAFTEGRAGKPPSFMRGMNRRSLFGVRVGDAFPQLEQRERIQGEAMKTGRDAREQC